MAAHQAKMLATGFVEVGLPFWYSRQCRVTVPASQHLYLAIPCSGVLVHAAAWRS